MIEDIIGKKKRYSVWYMDCH